MGKASFGVAFGFRLLGLAMVAVLSIGSGCGGSDRLFGGTAPTKSTDAGVARVEIPPPPDLEVLLDGRPLEFTSGKGEVQAEAQLSLKAGWNLISFPVAEVTSVTPGAGVLNVLFAFGNSQYTLVDFTPASLNANGGTARGFWAFCAQDTSISFDGTAPAGSGAYIELSSGFNIVGFPVASAVAAGGMAVYPTGGAIRTLNSSVCPQTVPPDPATCFVLQNAYPYSNGTYQVRDLSQSGTSFSPGEAAWVFVHAPLRFYYSLPTPPPPPDPSPSPSPTASPSPSPSPSPAPSPSPSVLDLVSVSSSGGASNGISSAPSVSSDGRYVAFQSGASNLVAEDTNGVEDIFVRDRQLGVTVRASVSSQGIQGNGACRLPSVSADGRYVAFSSHASNLVAGDTNGAEDVFVHDLQTSATTRVSVSTAGAQADGGSLRAAISGNGRYVVYDSTATTLVSPDSNADLNDVYLHDRDTGTTTRVSISSFDLQGNDNSLEADINYDGTVIVFASSATNLIGVNADTNGLKDVFRRQGGTTTRVSVSSAGAAPSGGASYSPRVSADGRYVAFPSSATNLVSGDTNAVTDVFVRDTQAGTTIRASLGASGSQGTIFGWLTCSISGNGRYVGYWGGPLVYPNNSTADRDVFVSDHPTAQIVLASRPDADATTTGTATDPSLSSDARWIGFTWEGPGLLSLDSNAFRDIYINRNTLVP